MTDDVLVRIKRFLDRDPDFMETNKWLDSLEQTLRDARAEIELHRAMRDAQSISASERHVLAIADRPIGIRLSELDGGYEPLCRSLTCRGLLQYDMLNRNFRLTPHGTAVLAHADALDKIKGTPETARPIKIGDTVKLKGTYGPKMTVVDRGKMGNSFRLVWFDEKYPQSLEVAPEALEVVP